MKRYTIGIITGILLTASAFMFMGANNQKSNENGKYQIITFTYTGMNQIAMLDTRNGDLYLSQGKTHNAKLETVSWIKKTRPNPFP